MSAALVVCGSGVIMLLVAVAIAAERRQITVGVMLEQIRVWLRRFMDRFQMAVQQHPLPIAGAVESGIWLLMLLPLLDALTQPQGSLTARLVWYLAIAPHEIGHLVCIPFGRILSIAGGSFWQVGFWAGLAIYSFMRRRQVTLSLIFWLITAHSLINLSVYIRDAQERDLPLLFGLSEDAHDWYNLLHWMGLLHYDNFIADGVVVIAALLAVGVISLGIISAWMLPREGFGQRF